MTGNCIGSFAQIAFYLIIIIISFAIGLAFILLSKNKQENWIPRSFIYGTGILLIISYWISYFSASGFCKIAIPAILFLLACAAVLFIIKRKMLLQYIKETSGGDLINLAACCMLGALPLFMIIVFGAQYPYCDGYTYICNADYLMEHGYQVLVNPEDTIMHPWLSQTLLYQTAHFRIGAQMLLAFFSSIFGVRFSLELFLPVTAFGVFLWGMGIWNFMTKRYAVNRYARVLAIILVTGNVPIVLWNAVYGFLPQIFGSAFFISAIAGIFCFSKWKEEKIWCIFSTAMLFSCEALVYNEMLPFLVLVTIVYMVRYICLHKEEWKKVIIYMLACAIVAISAIITYIPGMIHAVLTMFGGIVGWHQEKDINTYLAYFMSSVPAEYSFMTSGYDMKMYLYEALTLIMGVIVVIGFYKSGKENKKEFFLVSMPYLLMLLYFAFCTENPFCGGKGNSWSIYKLMQYYFVMAIPYISMFIAEAAGKIRKSVFAAAIIIFVTFNVYNLLSYENTLSESMEKFVGRTSDSIEEYYSLYEKYGNTQEIITLYNIPQKHRQMITYFLKNARLLSDWESDGYYSNIPATPKELYGTGINLTYDPLDRKSIAGLVARDADIVPAEGFYETERYGEEYWNWSKRESELNIFYYAVDEKYTLRCEMLGTNQEEQKINIYSNAGELLQTVKIEPNETTTISIDIDEYVNTLRFECSGEIIKFENDPRELMFAISNYSIEKR